MRRWYDRDVVALEGADTAVWLDRYRLYDEIGAGATSRVYLAKLVGAAGFARAVVVKVLREEAARDETLRAMFVDEARLSSRIDSPHVVRTLDVVDAGSRVGLVMEYVLGASLATALSRSSAPVPVAVAVAIASDVLRGLHAAHEARGEDGLLLGIVHRDVSPSNVLVGKDGRTRLIDFGIAKARARSTETASGVTKGKLGYMAPEQREGRHVSRETDVFALGVLLWELLVGRSLFEDGDPPLHPAARQGVPAPGSRRADVPVALDRVVLSALQPLPKDRPPTAMAMLEALSSACPAAKPADVARWLDGVAGLEIEMAEEVFAKLERADTGAARPGATPEARSPSSSHVRRLGWRAPAALALAFAIGSALLIFRRASPRHDPSPDPADAAQGAVEASSAAAEVVEGGAPVEAVAQPPTSASAVVHVRRRPPAKPSKGPCDPPYRFDADGHKLFIPSCL